MVRRGIEWAEWMEMAKASFREEKPVWSAHTTEVESKAIDLSEPMTGWYPAIIMTNEQSFH